jgi:hypothetical protein
MEVKVNVKEQYSNSPGKTQKYDSPFFDVVAGKHWLSITGESSSERGDGSRGGEVKYYDNKVTIRLNKADLSKIINTAITQKFFTPDSSDKEKIEKARKHLDDAIKILNE